MYTTYVTLLTLFLGLASAIWPVPISYSEGNGTVVLADDFTIEYIGLDGNTATRCASSKKVWGAIMRTYRLLGDGFVPSMLYPFEEDFEPSVEEMSTAQRLEKLVITQT